MVRTMKKITTKCLSAVVLGGLWVIASLASAQSTTTGPTAATTNGASSGNYPSGAAVDSNSRVMPPGKSPAQSSAGAVATPQSGNYPGTGSSVKQATGTSTPTPAPGKSPAQSSAGAVATPQSGNYPGTGSSVKHATGTSTPTPAPGKSPAQASAGAVATPKSGNYPGTGSGQQ